MNVNLCLISWFNHGQLFNKFKPLNIWIKIIFIELLLERKLSFIRVLTLMWFGGLFCARPAIFPPFRQVWSLGFLWSSLQHFWSVFLFDFLKWNSTLCQIYWIPDLQLLKWACFMVAKTWKRKYADSRLFWTKWPCFSRPTTCENTSNTGRILLIFINI